MMQYVVEIRLFKGLPDEESQNIECKYFTLKEQGELTEAILEAQAFAASATCGMHNVHSLGVYVCRDRLQSTVELYDTGARFFPKDYVWERHKNLLGQTKKITAPVNEGTTFKPEEKQ